MSRNRSIMLPAILLALLLAVGTTSAAAQNVPPGVSGANQYTETLPGPGGNSAEGGEAAGPGGPSGGSKSPSQTLGAANARKLEALGPEGEAAAALATESSPAGGSEKHQKKGKHHAGGGAKSGGAKPGNATGGDNPGASGGSSGVKQVLGQITGTGGSDSGGMSWLLPLLIGGSILLAATYIFARHRPARPQD